MYTELEIKSTSERAYIEYYFDGIRQREYNGSKLGLSLSPNRAKNNSDKVKLLNKLKYEFQKALEKGWNPLLFEQTIATKSIEISLEAEIKAKLEAKLNGHYSKTYKRDLKSIAAKFLSFISETEKMSPTSKLQPGRIAEFLNSFKGSNRNYMNKRQNLNVLIPGTIQTTQRKKSVERLHEIYTREEMLLILEFLKAHYPKLHLVALLAYGCFLRPHEESRLLQRKQVRNSKIYLSGDENKGRKVRTVNIPSYIEPHLKHYLDCCTEPISYLFTGTDSPVNDDYFRTQWSRAKKKMIDLKLIQPKQTLYSFRHTGAVNVYRKTKDIYIVQKLFDHSSPLVTMKYLRGLGELGNDDLLDALPEL